MLFDKISLPPLLSWLRAHLVHFSGKDFVNNRMVEGVKMKIKACFGPEVHIPTLPEVMCIFPSR